MPLPLISELTDPKTTIPRDAIARGWVRTRRESKSGVSFVHISDGSCQHTLQLVVPSSLSNYTTEVSKLGPGCSIEAAGQLVNSTGRGQQVELLVTELKIVGWVDNPDTYPIQPKRHSLEFLRDHAHLRPRTNTFGAVARIRDSLSAHVHRYLRSMGFIWVHTPIITPSDCEGAGALFRVSTLDWANRSSSGDYSEDFFGKETFLTVSGQLQLETYCSALSRVYSFGPTFRAENSNTSRHLAEFWMVEPEIAFADLSDDAALALDFLRAVVSGVLEDCTQEMQFFQDHVDNQCIERAKAFVDASAERLEYSEVVDLLTRAEAGGHNFEFPVRYGMDLQSEHERYLTEHIVKRPVVVSNFPRTLKPFYMRLNDDDRTVAAMDILVPGVGEIVGGAQREERLEVLDRRMQEMRLSPDSYWWYRDLRLFGTVPHAGFGLGLERMLCYLTGLSNVRDVIPFPRTPRHADI